MRTVAMPHVARAKDGPSAADRTSTSASLCEFVFARTTKRPVPVGQEVTWPRALERCGGRVYGELLLPALLLSCYW